jgi:hypothetical protein
MRPESQAQASDRRCAPPHGLVWAVGGLPHTADPTHDCCQAAGISEMSAEKSGLAGPVGPR